MNGVSRPYNRYQIMLYYLFSWIQVIRYSIDSNNYLAKDLKFVDF